MNQDGENGLSPFLLRASVTLWQFKLVRQVRLELTLPRLRGRCLDPIWPLTHACQKPARKQGLHCRKRALPNGRASDTELAELNGLEPSST
jgi:hypothetical protein